MIQPLQSQFTACFVRPLYDAAWVSRGSLLYDDVSVELGPAAMTGRLEDIINTGHEAIIEFRVRCKSVTEAGINGLGSEVKYVRFDLN